MSDLLTHVARLEMVDVDLNLDPQCESPWHGSWEQGRQHDGGPATHVVRSNCSHVSGLRCGTWVRVLVAEGFLRCTRCNRVVDLSEVRFIEL